MTTMRFGVARLGVLGSGLAVAVLSIAGGMALAQGPDGGQGMGPHRPPMERAMGPGGGMRGDHGQWWNSPRAIEKLKLTDAQRKAMDDIYQQHRLKLVDLHATLEKEELTMEPMMRADQPDEGKILAQIDKVAQARAELEKANARMLLGMRRQLTPEQWKLMEAERAAHRDGRDGERGQGHGGPQNWHRPGSGPGAGGPGGGPGSSAPPAQNPGGPNGVDGPGMDQ
jgi:periplasmic protein CpxP/Spy